VQWGTDSLRSRPPEGGLPWPSGLRFRTPPGADGHLGRSEAIGFGAQADLAGLLARLHDGEAAAAKEAVSVAAVGFGMARVVAAQGGDVARARDAEDDGVVGGRHRSAFHIDGLHRDVGEVVGIGPDGIAVGGEAKTLGCTASHQRALRHLRAAPVAHGRQLPGGVGHLECRDQPIRLGHELPANWPAVQQ